MAAENDSQWHMSKRISIETVVLMLCQTIALVWFASKMDSRVENLEAYNQVVVEVVKAMPKLDSRIGTLEDKQISMLTLIDRLSKVEAEMAGLRELVKIQSSVLRSIDQKLPTSPDEGGRP